MLPRTLRTITRPEISVTFPNGASSNFLNVWLRDHCREKRSYHPTTKQKLVDTASIPSDIRPDAVREVQGGIVVTWPTSSFEEGYESFYPWSFLIKYSYNPPLFDEPVKRKKTLWTSEIRSSPPTVFYEEVMTSEAGVYEWLRRIDEFGFSLVTGIPPTPEATEELVRRIAFIRETHYGGFWDFTADLKHGDLAYSDVELRGHTDTTYFTDACGLQLFHLLSPSHTHSGGHNLLIDGFRAASLLLAHHPHIYSLFSTLPVPSHASGSGSDSLPSGVHMKPLVQQPVLVHDQEGELVQVRWNGDDRGVVGGKGWEGRMEEWYEGVRVWEAILRSEEAAMWTVMRRGTAVIFDNHRVLHGRSSFTGQRRLCGAMTPGRRKDGSARGKDEDEQTNASGGNGATTRVASYIKTSHYFPAGTQILSERPLFTTPSYPAPTTSEIKT
ncbi:trimethyllysine dioxygenase, partial [Pseudohyphozyma bogoriensis]